MNPLKKFCGNMGRTATALLIAGTSVFGGMPGMVSTAEAAPTHQAGSNISSERTLDSYYTGTAQQKEAFKEAARDVLTSYRDQNGWSNTKHGNLSAMNFLSRGLLSGSRLGNDLYQRLRGYADIYRDKKVPNAVDSPWVVAISSAVERGKMSRPGQPLKYTKYGSPESQDVLFNGFKNIMQNREFQKDFNFDVLRKGIVSEFYGFDMDAPSTEASSDSLDGMGF